MLDQILLALAVILLVGAGAFLLMREQFEPIQELNDNQIQSKEEVQQDIEKIKKIQQELEANQAEAPMQGVGECDPLDNLVGDSNYLVSGFNIGMNSKQGHRNANLQLRSDPPIEINRDISPWGVSSYLIDTDRLKFEIGQ